MLGVVLGLSLGCGTQVTGVIAPAVQPTQSRTIEFEYKVRVSASETQPLELFLPLPAELPHQRISGLVIESSVVGLVQEESRFGNRFWHGQVPANAGLVDVVLRFEVERDPLVPSLEGVSPTALHLEPHLRVPTENDALLPMIQAIRSGSSDDPASRARGIYDWVVANIDYRKDGSGWGNGDTLWACSERYGNCTDFHSLILSLARYEAIPARFEMGFPVPQGQDEGAIGGYHCWASLFVEGQGWLPMDASEARKNPEKQEMFYGTLPMDRVRFTVGRDLRLGDAHLGAPLNYFIHPYAEMNGVDATSRVESNYRFWSVSG